MCDQSKLNLTLTLILSPDTTTKQYAAPVVSIQLNIVTYPAYPDISIQASAVALFLLLRSGGYSIVIEHWGARPPLYKWLGTGDTVSRRTANKKLTKLC